MEGIIFFIIVFFLMIKSGKKKNKSNNNSSSILDNMQQSNKINYGVTSATSASSYGSAQEAVNAVKQRQNEIGSRTQSSTTATNERSSVNTHASNSVQQKEGQSMTAYLGEKAWKDQVEHAKEKAEENARVNQKYGGRPTALRYILGDPVPFGFHLKICPYCAAENLVRLDDKRILSCYFCRTQL